MITIEHLKPENISRDYENIQKNEAHLATFGEGYPGVHNTNQYFRYLLSIYGDLETIALKRFTIMYDNIAVGQIGLHSFVIQNFTSTAEIFYWIDEKYQGKGIVTKALQLLEQYSFKELGVELLIIHCLEANEKSANVALRCNFQFEGISKFLQDGQLVNYKKFIKSSDL